MIGDLVQTVRGWELQAPMECVNGHPLTAGKTLVGHQPCICRGSHMGWTCRICESTFYWPPTDPTCSVLVGAARVR